MARQRRQELRVRNPPRERPLMVFDGDCNVCRRWISRWHAATGERVEYRPFQEVAERFPELPRTAFEKAVQLIETDGNVSSGADAVFRLFDFALKKRPLLGALQRVPGFKPLARGAYRFVATHRTWLAVVTRLIWGRSPSPPQARP
jgi:predicted DCC family thiol-disulfide oxidoreductase YuxK